MHCTSMNMLRRIETLYFVSLFIFLFISIQAASVRLTTTCDQDIVTQDDVFTDNSQDNNGVSSHLSGSETEHNLVLLNEEHSSINNSDMSLALWSNILSISKSCRIVKIIMHEVPLISQDFFNTFFHPPKTFLA